jgi:hypothetical protein
VWLRTYNLENTLYFKNVSNQERKVSGPYYEETVMKTPTKVIEKISLPLMFGMFVVAVLVFAVSPVSAAPICVDADGDLYYKFHRKHCPEGDDPDDSNCNIIPKGADVLNPDCDDPSTPGSTPDPTTLTRCEDTEKSFCLASVGKWHKPAARLYVENKFGATGSYTEIPPNVFGNILAALSGEDDFDSLCDAYNVLIFQWKSPGIKNLTWKSLVDYMACGGGVVFEDPSNVDALIPGVTTTNIYIHSGTTPPITIAFDPACFYDDHPLCRPLQHPNESYVDIYAFDINNNHMEFTYPQTNPILIPFLRLAPTWEVVVGLYGEHLVGDEVRGRIVLTGPDNSFHGIYPHGEYDPLPEVHHNQYELLYNEIDWVSGIGIEPE